MTKSEFQEFISQVGNFYGYSKIVDMERLNAWYAEVKNIPSEPLPQIMSKIYTEKDTMPRNMPKIIKEFFSEWLAANPDKMFKNREQRHCDECGGKGFLWCKRPAHVEGRPFTGPDGNVIFEKITYRCAKCDNWARYVSNQAMPSATKSYITDEKHYTLI
jgi:hypothetical protein